ncbi:MAG TPA: SigE family RNA polymerase sigma factor [Mycobacteriales bacterium]|nr:SigE family RNA polymerase sigma factor [Mycobacteriales bacterium]
MDQQTAEVFDAFVRARHHALLRYGTVLTGDLHSAADLVQDALERTGLAWSRVQQQGDPEGYVRRVMANRSISTWRKLRRERLVGDPPEASYEDQPVDRVLWDVLARLPRRQRTVLVLRYYEDLSEAEIARVLGIAPGTVKSQASKGIAALRAALGSREALWT